MVNIDIGDAPLGIDNKLELPKMVKVKQKFVTKGMNKQEIESTLKSQFERKDVSYKISTGMKIAVGVGSRGIQNLPEIVKSTVNEIKQKGGIPFIVPAMGSHGGGKAEGQAKVLEKLGVTEEKVGAPIRSSMETVHLGTVLGDIDVYFDKIAFEEADGIVVVSRVKPHTDFKAPIESGIHKMLGIGLGKHKGASYLHRGGMSDFGTVLTHAGKLIMEKTPFLFGIGIVEDSNHQTAMVEVVTKEQLPEREQELLIEAKKLMPKFYFTHIDVLIIDEIGKNISGSGLDPNIVGRTGNSKFEGKFGEGPEINKIVILGLTKETNGNGVGIGLADFSTKRTIEEIDFRQVYTNALTAIEIGAGKIPIILPNDKEAISVGIYTSGNRNLANAKVVRIKDTLSLNEILVSENMIDEVQNHPMMEVFGETNNWKFDELGNLVF